MQTGTWNELVKAAPKAASGQGTGGGRKPKTPKGPAEKTAEDTASVPERFQQHTVALAAFAQKHKDELPSAWLKDLQALVLTVKQVPA